MTLRAAARLFPVTAAFFLLVLVTLLPNAPLHAHNVSDANANFLSNIDGAAVGLFAYLGAKHMVTGIDHVLYLLAVVFLLHKPRQIVFFVTLFALGHSLTLIAGVWFSVQVNPSLVDAIIGLSVAFKAFENLAGVSRNGVSLRGGMFTAFAVFGFGLVHGLGLATKLQAVYSGGDGLLANLFAFNVGVELGQLIALAALLVVLTGWRARHSFYAGSFVCNFLLLVSGFAFAGYHFFDNFMSAAETL